MKKLSMDFRPFLCQSSLNSIFTNLLKYLHIYVSCLLSHILSHILGCETITYSYNDLVSNHCHCHSSTNAKIYAAFDRRAKDQTILRASCQHSTCSNQRKLKRGHFFCCQRSGNTLCLKWMFGQVRTSIGMAEITHCTPEPWLCQVTLLYFGALPCG